MCSLGIINLCLFSEHKSLKTVPIIRHWKILQFLKQTKSDYLWSYLYIPKPFKCLISLIFVFEVLKPLLSLTCFACKVRTMGPQGP